MQKILTAQIREECYDLLISCRLSSEKQNGCYKWTRSTGELLYVGCGSSRVTVNENNFYQFIKTHQPNENFPLNLLIPIKSTGIIPSNLLTHKKIIGTNTSFGMK